MNKIIKFLTILVTVLTVSSCGSKNLQTNSMNESESEYYTKKIGFISTISDSNNIVKKILITENKEEFYITSSNLNLDNDKFKNKKVEVYGLIKVKESNDRDSIEAEEIHLLR